MTRRQYTVEVIRQTGSYFFGPMSSALYSIDKVADALAEEGDVIGVQVHILNPPDTALSEAERLD